MFLISKIQEKCFFFFFKKQVFENRKQKLLPNITSFYVLVFLHKQVI